MKQYNLDETYKALQETYKNSPEVTIMKGDGVASLETFPDNTFDMIYIDGDHSYEGCRRDLMVAYAKVKPGGFIMGHDYEMNMCKARNYYNFGVKNAVDQFCELFGQKLVARGLDGCVSYAIQLQK